MIVIITIFLIFHCNFLKITLFVFVYYHLFSYWWFQVFLSYTNNFKHNYLICRWILTHTTILSVRVDLDVMKIKRYSTLLITLELKSHHQMQFGVISGTYLWLESNPSAEGVVRMFSVPPTGQVDKKYLVLSRKNLLYR